MEGLFFAIGFLLGGVFGVLINKPDELAGVLTDAFAQWDEAEYGTAQ